MIVDVDGKAMAAACCKQRSRLASLATSCTLSFKRRGGATGTATITLKEDPSVDVVTRRVHGRDADAPSRKRFAIRGWDPKAK